jgi:hypothetical protein
MNSAMRTAGIISGIAIAVSIVVGLVIVVIGRVNGWTTSLLYSNAFFVAGVLIAGAGIANRLRPQSDLTRNSQNLVIVCFLSGTCLILASVLISKLF